MKKKPVKNKTKQIYIITHYNKSSLNVCNKQPNQIKSIDTLKIYHIDKIKITLKNIKLFIFQILTSIILDKEKKNK